MSSASPDLKKLLVEVAFDYPSESRRYALGEIERTAFHLEIVRQKKRDEYRNLRCGRKH